MHRSKWRAGIAAVALSGVLATSLLVPVTAQAAESEITDAVFEWGLNAESGSAGYAPRTCNFLGAGVSGDNESSSIWQGKQEENGKVFVNPANSDVMWRQNDDNTSILKPNSNGELVPTTWDTKCQTRDGSRTNTSGKTSENIVRIVKGTGTVDPETNSAQIRWFGSFSVIYYSGMTYWSVVNPKLNVVNGEGVLTGRLSGYGTSMEDQSQWKRLRAREVTLATLKNVTVTDSGIKVTPEYKGVEVTPPLGGTQARTGANWGSWPQEFVDFQGETGQAAYWYSSGGSADSRKVPTEIGISYTTPNIVTHAVTVEGGKASQAQAAKGEKVTLTASVPEGKRFLEWRTETAGVSFANAKDANTSFMMPASAVTVTAVFEDKPAAVAHAIAVTGGTASAQTALAGETVTITAQVPENHHFLRWTSETPGVEPTAWTSPQTSFTMPDADVNLTATFGRNTAPTNRASASVTVEPHENLDPAARNVLTISGKDFVSDAARNGVYVVVSEEAMWKPGEYVRTQGLGEGEFIAAQWVTPEQLKANDGAFKIDVVLAANSMDRNKTYYAGTMAAHALALTERSIDRAEKLTFKAIDYDPNAIFAPDTVAATVQEKGDVAAEWSYSGATPARGWEVLITCVEQCSDPLYQSKQKNLSDPEARSETFSSVPNGVYTVSVRSAGWYGNEYKQTDWVVSDKLYIGVEKQADSNTEPGDSNAEPVAPVDKPSEPAAPAVPAETDDAGTEAPAADTNDAPADADNAPADNAPATVKPQLTLSQTELAVGDALDILAAGFIPGTEVTFEVHSDPLVIGTVKADAQGAASLAWKVPSTLPAGSHTVIATGLARSADGAEQKVSVSQEITIKAAASGATQAAPVTASGKQTLANTGAPDATLALLIGAGVLALGGALLTARRRTRS
ncbi:InlB B-repeat-containing protein [Canibacter zhoujuaniae]|uniref:InlB B-repeat-containing protein n=1 Tax=Canibacter zhoujuaniae TaxID=2708343 RepID=UPI001424890B|nr:hypothetical protein [Canibacter zhoujuaniae]